MSASPFLRCALASVIVLTGGCERDPGAESTLPPTGRGANPEAVVAAPDQPEPVSPAEEVVEDAPTPAGLQAFVERRARALARAPYRPRPTSLPGGLDELDYDSHRAIRFRPDAALWSSEGRFQVQLFHPGSLFTKPVRLHVVDDSVRALPFDPDLFRYEGPAAGVRERVAPVADRLGYAGFRVHFPLNDADRMDEVAVFQGASYFRLVGPGQVYGLSGRGLAIDVASDRPEEFPDFTEFWLVRPAPDADTLIVHALLESPSVTGAYRFALVPGDRTELVVDARLFARTDVVKLGVAPLSSMFLYDANLAGAFDDFRPEVHDSDGLLMHTRSEEWIWRPLGNRRGLRVTSLRDVDPLGFGLAQRARDFDAYLDLEARYHLRPSAWVRVDSADRWGPGGVELLEIPTETEFNDNIAAYWVPDGPFLAGDARRYRYKVSTFEARLPQQTLGQVVRTRVGSTSLPGAPAEDATHSRRFVIDFGGGPLEGLGPDTDVEVIAETLAGSIDEVRAEPLPDGAGWRASFRVRAGGDRPPDMRVYLASGGRPLTETWSYAWYPEHP
jgi:glucans biosynthesis protein